MKILLVSIPNHHFFQWANQLKDSGYEVHWFDITDGAGFVNKISWIKQYNGWKLKWNFPLRYTLKRLHPWLYNVIERYNTNKVDAVFDQVIEKFKPDVVHSFELKLSGLPILSTMEKHSVIPLIYSSWGSDMFYFEHLGVSKDEVERFLRRANYMISDCSRDYDLAKRNGFNANFLGVYPGNGGIAFPKNKIRSIEQRKTITIKGYEDGVGQAIVVLKALEELPKSFFENKNVVVYSADQSVEDYIKSSTLLSSLDIEIFLRSGFVANENLLKIMGRSSIHIASSVSDGMPNALLEAMGMGAFPIQSNPGKVTEEVITHGVNGYLIESPVDVQEIARLIKEASEAKELRREAQRYNESFIHKRCDRDKLKDKIIRIYSNV